MRTAANDLYVKSFSRRWSQAVSVFPLSLWRKGIEGGVPSNGSKPHSLSFDQLPEVGGLERRINPFNLAVSQNYFEPLCKLMDSFWRQLSDVALFPLTTEFYPTEFPKKRYTNDSHQHNDLDIEENLCLRLTQNFQFVNKRGSCDFEKDQRNLKYGVYLYKMAFRDVYSHSKMTGPGTFETQTCFKEKKDNKVALKDTEADFRYLLYNHQTR